MKTILKGISVSEDSFDRGFGEGSFCTLMGKAKKEGKCLIMLGQLPSFKRGNDYVVFCIVPNGTAAMGWYRTIFPLRSKRSKKRFFDKVCPGLVKAARVR